MKLTIEAWTAGLQTDWSFACLLEVDGRRLLFDTGGHGTILLH
jgi:metal-dependent hydrolase (beta-lactamase superfamily II)